MSESDALRSTDREEIYRRSRKGALLAVKEEDKLIEPEVLDCIVMHLKCRQPQIKFSFTFN